MKARRAHVPVPTERRSGAHHARCAARRSLLLQFWIVPNLAADAATRYPELAGLARPYVIAIGGVGGLGLFEVALLAAWRVLSEAAKSDGATTRKKRWADVVTLALVLMAVVFAGVFVTRAPSPASAVRRCSSA